ncbi:MAG: aspartate--tRNA ligase [Phycisphaerales bacterium]|nr:aspartate--tRNA ligase [Phycisphaerales bacterium]
MFRTHSCGELSVAHLNQKVTLAGWVQTIRKFGAITFVDLRDRYGITQLVIGDEINNHLDNNPLGREFVIQAFGFVRERSNKNKNIPTGDIEVNLESYIVLNSAAVPPFTIQDDTDGGDDLRMKYRYLDLRRSCIKNNLLLRYAVTRSVRNFLHEQQFIDIETPFLIKSTPEGARDFVVPSRMNPHEFYALPQSPQTFKQLLMVSGYDRYYQIVKCFRDEDLRSDRQPEFTQIDCEMSFVQQEDILDTFERLVKCVFKEVINIDLKEPFERMSWEDAMWYYGNDKPDTRFAMPITNLKVPTWIFKNKQTLIPKTCVLENGFPVFDQAETILAITIPNASEYSRKQLDELTEWVKRPQIGMNGMAYIKYQKDGNCKSSFDKFYNADNIMGIASACSAKPDDLILILVGKEEKTRKAMSELRLDINARMGNRKKNEYKVLWILDFPLFEYSEDENRWIAKHHPFTAPHPHDIDTMLNNKPAIDNPHEYLKHPYCNLKANAYDMVLNGNEIGGGSIRIHKKELQEKMFESLGISEDEQKKQFGFLLNAFEYGAPPHGGIAFGLDRLCALLGGSESIRDFIAFPKNNAGRDTMLNSPDFLEVKQLSELNIELKK